MQIPPSCICLQATAHFAARKSSVLNSSPFQLVTVTFSFPTSTISSHHPLVAVFFSFDQTVFWPTQTPTPPRTIVSTQRISLPSHPEVTFSSRATWKTDPAQPPRIQRRRHRGMRSKSTFSRFLRSHHSTTRSFQSSPCLFLYTDLDSPTLRYLSSGVPLPTTLWSEPLARKPTQRHLKTKRRRWGKGI